MAVKTIDEIMASVRTRIGEDTSDEALGFIEDIQDTLDDMSKRVKESGDWKQKYEENDKNWREKYQKRFFEGTSEDPNQPPVPDPDPDTDPPKTFEELFKFE